MKLDQGILEEKNKGIFSFEIGDITITNNTQYHPS